MRRSPIVKAETPYERKQRAAVFFQAEGRIELLPR